MAGPFSLSSHLQKRSNLTTAISGLGRSTKSLQASASLEGTRTKLFVPTQRCIACGITGLKDHLVAKSSSC